MLRITGRDPALEGDIALQNRFDNGCFPAGNSGLAFSFVPTAAGRAKIQEVQERLVSPISAASLTSELESKHRQDFRFRVSQDACSISV